ncbi:hypothetical protein FQA39_LY07663 [Lamprigera yunnana]|nr:hypothetical protein FQA39_LY07663 [Lamprigera yunnana]
MDYYNINLKDMPASVPTSQPNTLNFPIPFYSASGRHFNYSTAPVDQSSSSNYLQHYDLSAPPSMSLETKSDEELWIETWLSKIGKIQINLNSTTEIKSKRSVSLKPNSIQIHNIKNTLKNSIHILSNLQSLQAVLKENAATMSSTEWTKKTMEIGLIKEQFSKNILQFENFENLKRIQKVIEKRRKKRAVQKRRKKFQSEETFKMHEDRRKVHKKIDQWLEHMKEEVERSKMEENMKKDADCVLAEVTKKKSDARKAITLITSLIKLRQVREHTATQRGERVSLEDRNAFSKVTTHLLKIWNDALKVYTKEEQGLRVMLQQNAADDTNFAQLAKEKRIVQEWETVFFGLKCIPNHIYWDLTAAEKSLETFIAVRKSWDTFLTSNSDGSRIPVGWIMPNLHPNQDWSKYLER